MKIVMDTNVVLAGMISPEGLSSLLILALDGESFLNYTSEDALDELALKIGILAEKGKLSTEWKRILAHYLKCSAVISPSRRFNLSKDPDDNKWLEIVYESKAEFLLTWDKDLLLLRDSEKNLRLEEHTFKILKPIEFYHDVFK